MTESILRLINDSFSDISCVHAGTGSKGLAYLNSNHFDIVILDINLPDISGIEFCSIARSRVPDLRVLVVTSLAQRHVIEGSLQAGVNGIVLKTSDINDITDAISKVLEGGSYFGKGVKELISTKKGKENNEPVITRRETEILKLIADGLTNQEIAEKLFISASTVDSHRKNLLIKLEARNTAALIKTAISKGII